VKHIITWTMLAAAFLVGMAFGMVWGGIVVMALVMGVRN
jgi:hypothetical protein